MIKSAHIFKFYRKRSLRQSNRYRTYNRCPHPNPNKDRTWFSFTNEYCVGKSYTNSDIDCSTTNCGMYHSFTDIRREIQ